MSASLCLLPGPAKARGGEERSRNGWLVEQGQEWFAIWRVNSLGSEGDESSPIMGGKSNQTQMMFLSGGGGASIVMPCF